ncbi:MAG: conjugal transfer protein TraU [Desulfovibrio sp.]|nr:conjugal transfer protein TraU [Desulfovibrio sp.]
MRGKAICLALGIVLLGLAVWQPAAAQSTPAGQCTSSGSSSTPQCASSGTSKDPTCPDGELLSAKLITDICWSCIFPIQVGGVKLFGGDNPVPIEAADDAICACNNANDVPTLGITLGMWQPAQVMEIVRGPGCAPALGGITLPLGNAYFRGTTGHGVHSGQEKAFYHYHKYAFPLLAILELFTAPHCFGDGFMDFDLVYVSEVDPTWNNDELAFFADPEAALTANPIAAAACIGDAAMAAADQVSNVMYWCAGSWGLLYPFSGQMDANGSMPRKTSLLATRAIAALHRRGLAWQTMGNGAVCKAYIQPMFPKDMYRMSMFYPSNEGSGTASIPSGGGSGQTLSTIGSHPIGQSTVMWGSWRSWPITGEDALYIIFRWNDCCASL